MYIYIYMLHKFISFVFVKDILCLLYKNLEKYYLINDICFLYTYLVQHN